MSDDNETKVRLVVPRRWLIASTMVTIGALAAGPVLASGGQSDETKAAPAEGGEGGEGAAVAALEGDAEFLSELGLFEAAHVIVAALYAEGDVAAAQEHLEQSHHAYYEDIEDDLNEHGAAQFEAEAEAFAAAVREGRDAAEVSALADAVLAAITAAQAGAEPADAMKAVETLVRIAAADYEASLTDGEVTAPQEYRDAWGFAEVAKRRLQALAASSDATVAGAAEAGLAALEPAAEQLPGVSATKVPGDVSVLLGAAARIELASYRLRS